MTHTVTLPWPSKHLSRNARVHWAVRFRATKAARTLAFWEGRVAKLPPTPDAVMTFTFHPPDNRRRDAHNMPDMMKAYIDGLADAMGVDDLNFQCRFPSKFAEVRKGGQVVVEITAPSVLVEHRGTIND